MRHHLYTISLLSLKKDKIHHVTVEAFTPDLSMPVCLRVHTQRRWPFSSYSVRFYHCDNPVFLETLANIPLLCRRTKQDRDIDLTDSKKKG